MLGLEEYKHRVESYTAKDYNEGYYELHINNVDQLKDVYEELAEAVDYETAKFDQYAAIVLKPDALQKGVDKNFFDALISLKRDAITKLNGQPDILSVIDDIEKKAKTDGSATLLPLLCGSGKSTAITKKIIETLGGKLEESLQNLVAHMNNQIYMGAEMMKRRPYAKRIVLPELPEGYEPSEVGEEIVDKLDEYYPTDSVDEWLEGIEKEVKRCNDIIAEKIAEHSEYMKQHGLLIVTDNTDRMKDYWNPEKAKDNSRLSGFEKSFITEHEEDVLIWAGQKTTKNFVTKSKKKAVVIMTTQRFFDYIKEEDLMTVISGGDFKKSLIIFDETPYLAGIRDIDAVTLNEISSGLYLTLRDDMDPDDRNWCLDQWENFRTRLLGVLRRLEDEHTYQTRYYEDETKLITEDDERFFRIIEENKSLFIRNENYESTYKQIQDVHKLICDWGIYSFRSGKEVRDYYSSKFSVYFDNRSAFEKLGAAIIILDGSGDISPIYINQDYITKESGENFERDLSALTIKLVNVSTNEEALRSKGDAIARAVKSHLLSDKTSISDTVVFTRKSAEHFFEHKGYKNTAHFGDIKGRNDFNGETLFAQVGINRNPPAWYETWFMARYPEYAEVLKSFYADPTSNTEEVIEMIKARKHIENMFILADLEQNIFRSAIRNIYNAKPVTYYIFFDTEHNVELVNEIHKRYDKDAGGMGGTVIDCELMNDGHQAAQPMNDEKKITNFMNNVWDGKLIKTKELYAMITEYCGVSKSMIRKMRGKKDSVRKIFERMAANAERKCGSKKGYYCK